MMEADRVEFLPEGFRLPRVDEEAYYLRAAAGAGDPSLLSLLHRDDTFIFGCKRCGHCCEARVPSAELLLPFEVEPLRVLAEAKRLPPPEPIETREGIRHSPPAKLARSCDWLRYPKGRSGAAECAVQERKPALCRLAPVAVMVDHPKRVVALLMAKNRRTQLTCFGMQGGPRYSVERWAEETDVAGFVEMAQRDWEDYQATLLAPAPAPEAGPEIPVFAIGESAGSAFDKPSLKARAIRLCRAFLAIFCRRRKES